MLMKSRRRPGLLVSPFLALLTIGLPKPSFEEKASEMSATQPDISMELEIEQTPDTGRPVNGSAANSQSANVSPPAAAQKTFDWDKAGEFQLAARIAVNRQMNRPKRPRKTVQSAKRTLTQAPALPIRTLLAKPRIDLQDKGHGAEIIIFPNNISENTGLVSIAA